MWKYLKAYLNYKNFQSSFFNILADLIAAYVWFKSSPNCCIMLLFDIVTAFAVGKSAYKTSYKVPMESTRLLLNNIFIWFSI